MVSDEADLTVRTDVMVSDEAVSEEASTLRQLLTVPPSDLLPAWMPPILLRKRRFTYNQETDK